MSSMPDYFTATNKAYEILSQVYPFSLETDIFKVLNLFPNIAIRTYTDWAKKFGLSFEETLEYLSSEHGFTIRDRANHFQISYNDKKDFPTIKFTLAHELGHIVMNHTKDDDIARKEASCFARNLLCPIPVIDELNIKTISDLTSVFGVGELMAEISLKHFESDRYYIRNGLYSNIRTQASAYLYGYDSVAEMYGVSYAYGY